MATQASRWAVSVGLAAVALAAGDAGLSCHRCACDEEPGCVCADGTSIADIEGDGCAGATPSCDCICAAHGGVEACLCADGSRQPDESGAECTDAMPSCDCICGSHGGACDPSFSPLCLCAGRPTGTPLLVPGCAASILACQASCPGSTATPACDGGLPWAGSVLYYANAQFSLPDGGSTVCYCNVCGCSTSPSADGDAPACP